MKKGKLKEIISRALYADITEKYTVIYRDMNMYPEVALSEFLSSGEIPFSRIVEIRRDGIVVWKKSGSNNFYTSD